VCGSNARHFLRHCSGPASQGAGISPVTGSGGRRSGWLLRPEVNWTGPAPAWRILGPPRAERPRFVEHSIWCDSVSLVNERGRRDMGRLSKSLISICLCALLVQPAMASNTPCSGRKGGVSHCQGRTFICNDGSVSASKKDCSAESGGASNQSLGLMGTEDAEMAPAGSQAECSCREGHYCTGPRGGRYCLTDSGAKSYLRK
jgi:hypothetical protein